ncbi:MULTISPECIES: hypothetical protein [Streptomyces]|uniref:Uncharacterized protein n=1 Tax=Streptomyces silvae TaxID=2803812 RepID=A0ABU7ZUA0_9ACTN|nr:MULTISPECIES: hypothetical protein [unclassified Streptomyces]MDX3326926.1 hypothetical protein [Streptomyces sp. ME02-6979-3A]MDX3433547.1 hypothetical protein [Streptomyces sp. ME01-18a]WSS73795.1 hypothetical protein OG414_00280 [Streptomyces sp. NBC_01174]WSS80797.1 hypothetical protein OG414_38935 [Streptomyces sp. NBC_01174]
MADSPCIYRWSTYFHDGDTTDVLYQQEEGILNLPIGSGVLVLGKCYRVVDSWFSYDDNGTFNLGQHVFLEKATDEDNRLKRIDPHYFRDIPDAY